MGQQEVYDFLCKHPGQWFTSREISEQLGVSIGSVTMSLKKLRKTNIIKYQNTGKRNTFIYTVEPSPFESEEPVAVEKSKPEKKQKKKAKEKKAAKKKAKKTTKRTAKKKPKKKR